MVEVIESEHPTSSAELSSLEVKYGFKFPAEYREFLLKYNGGRPSLSKFNFMELEGSYTDSLIDRFLSVYEGKYDNFEWTLRTVKVVRQRMPSNLVPIASDPFGNLVCISVDGKDLGYIYFWDHEKEEESANYNNVFLLARSFNDFLDRLF